MEAGSVERALAAVSRLGEFFDPGSSVPVGGGWRPVRDLVTDPDALRRRVAFVRDRLGGGAVEPRVAASLDLLGVAARLVSPVLATAALCGVVPVLDLDTVWWCDVDAPFATAVPDRPALAGVAVASATAAARALEAGLVDPLLLPLARAYGAASGLANGLLLGNLASAFAGAVTVLGATSRPLHIAPVGIVRELVAGGPLTGTGGYVTPFPPSDAAFFVRGSCCLYYRLPGGKCADCALLGDDDRHRAWRTALGGRPG